MSLLMLYAVFCDSDYTRIYDIELNNQLASSNTEEPRNSLAFFGDHEWLSYDSAPNIAGAWEVEVVTPSLTDKIIKITGS